MKKQFINYHLITSLGVCSIFIAFLGIFGTLYFRQKAFAYATNLRKIEKQCNVLQSEMLSLSAKIVQIQAPQYLRQKLVAFSILQNHQDRIFHIRNWSAYGGSHITRNALAMNIGEQFFQ